MIPVRPVCRSDRNFPGAPIPAPSLAFGPKFVKVRNGQNRGRLCSVLRRNQEARISFWALRQFHLSCRGNETAAQALNFPVSGMFKRRGRLRLLKYTPMDPQLAETTIKTYLNEIRNRLDKAAAFRDLASPSSDAQLRERRDCSPYIKIRLGKKAVLANRWVAEIAVQEVHIGRQAASVCCKGQTTAARTALAKCPSENWTSGLQKMAIIRALSLELLQIRSLTFGNVARIADA